MFGGIIKNMSRGLGRTKLVFAKNWPHISVVVGIVTVAGAAVWACRETLKIEGVLDEIKEDLEKVNSWKDEETRKKLEEKGYDENDHAKDLIRTYGKGAVGFGKLYVGPIVLGSIGVGLIVAGHVSLTNRLNAVMAAFALMDQEFRKYRKDVTTYFGEDAEDAIRHGLVPKSVETKEISRDDEENLQDRLMNGGELLHNINSPYGAVFKFGNPNWKNDFDHNAFFLSSQQEAMNNLLQTRGHVFLNDVYDALGLQRNNIGAVTGWVLGNGDDYIDFGMMQMDVPPDHEFKEGFANSVLLDFNVDGVIWDKI